MSSSLPELEPFTLPDHSSIDMDAFVNRYPQGRFILFRLNPFPLLELYEDEEAIKDAKKFRSKIYLGCVSMFPGLTLFGTYQLALSLHPVTTSPPKSSPLPGLTETSFIPVFPRTHPLNREAITPSQPLPFSDCLLFPCIRAINFMHGLDHGDDPTGCSISTGQLGTIVKTIRDDIRERRHLQTQQSSPQNPTPVVETVDDTPEFLRKYKQDGEELLEMFRTDDLNDHDEEPEDPLLDEERFLLCRLENLEWIPPATIEVWHDLSTFKEIGQIEDLLAESAALNKILKDLRQRTRNRLEEISKIKDERMEWIDAVNNVMQPNDGDTASIITIPADAAIQSELKGSIKESSSEGTISSTRGFGKRLLSYIRLRSRPSLPQTIKADETMSDEKAPTKKKKSHFTNVLNVIRKCFVCGHPVEKL
ncbi:hypothetical protein M422DRAFT_254833 [Sphaerobolus stellatus SS14]|uniref:Uncharacterized protein n=1 Tax=Sphaerobolus stellatus (strain SS14) TaxID=990650 RepID=A0A0C9V5F2_SPHS4|nr:hypothetical protein M422DRAFT_254833 [Sphaerobolus stellatus SS14]